MEAYLTLSPENEPVGVIRDVFTKKKYYFGKREEYETLIKDYEIRPPPALVRKYLGTATPPSNSCTFNWGEYPAKTLETMKPYQKETCERIIREFGGKTLLISPMGSGKTFMFCICVQYFLSTGGNTLIIVPNANLASNTQKELLTWTTIPSSKIKVMSELKDVLVNQVTICSYDCVTGNKTIQNHEWAHIVCDESQYLKNPESQRSQLVLKMLKEARGMRLLISATPQYKDNSELYCQLLPFLGKEVLGGSYESFCVRYCNAKWEQRGKLRRLKMHRPRFTEEVHLMIRQSCIQVDVDMSQYVPKSTLVRVDIDVDPNSSEMIQLTQVRKRLSEVMDNPNARDQCIGECWRLSGHAKFEHVFAWVTKWLEEHPGEKLVLFLHSESLIDKYELGLKKHKYTVARIDGKTATKKRKEIIAALSSLHDDTYRIGLLTFGTCSLGITLCPGVSTCGFPEMYHTPSVMEQCQGKLARLTAIRECVYYWFVAPETYDNSMMNKIQTKTELNELTMKNKKRRIEFSSS